MQFVKECRMREFLRFKSKIPVITRLSEAKTRTGKFFADTEFKASSLYELTVEKPDMHNETRTVLKFP